MAKETKEGKIQFVFVNVEGDQQTLQEALRQVGNTLNRGMNSEIRTLIAVPAQRVLDGKNDGSNTTQLYEVSEAETPAVDTEVKNTSSASTGSNPKRSKKTPPTPQLLEQLDINSGDVPFDKFIVQKDISTNYNKYLVIAAWFKRHMRTNEISTSHIYTLYQLMNWKAPDDMRQPFSDMKSKRDYFKKGAASGLWEITIVGLNRVDQMSAKGNRED